MQLSAESVDDTRVIADPASEEQSSNFHCVDHLDIPLLILRATEPQGYRSSFRTHFRKNLLFCFSPSWFRRIGKRVRKKLMLFESVVQAFKPLAATTDCYNQALLSISGSRLGAN